MIRMQRQLVQAGVAFVAAAIVFGAALVRALTIEEVPAAPAPPAGQPVETVASTAHEKPLPSGQSKTGAKTPPKPADASLNGATELDLDDIMVAVEHDPFRENRQRPNERYRLPGEEIPEEPPPPPIPPAPPFRVLGTVMMPEGGVALLQVQETPPRVYKQGETVFGYTLARVGQGTATMEGPGRTVTLRVEDPPQNRGGRGRAGRGAIPQPGRVNTPPAREMMERANQIREAIERLRSTGGDAQQIQQLMQMMEREMQNIGRTQGVELQRGGGAGGPVRVIRGDTVMVTTTRNE
jgi:hypothetical protein